MNDLPFDNRYRVSYLPYCYGIDKQGVLWIFSKGYHIIAKKENGVLTQIPLPVFKRKAKKRKAKSNPDRAVQVTRLSDMKPQRAPALRLSAGESRRAHNCIKDTVYDVWEDEKTKQVKAKAYADKIGFQIPCV